MKNWFPFTDYDFYAYLTSGSLLLAVVDFVLNGSTVISKASWTFVQVVIFVATAYVLGQLIASISQFVIEKPLIRGAVAHPITLMLGLRSPSWFERILGALAGHYYRSLPEAQRQRVLTAVADRLKKSTEDVRDSEEVFQAGYSLARSDPDTRSRMDDFRNQYGFCRNLALTSLLAIVIVVVRLVDGYEFNDELIVILATSLIVFFGMTIRFVKFYSCFSYEIVRSLVRQEQQR